VIEYNSTAMNLYTKLGFVYYSKEQDFYTFENGTTQHAFVYVLYINGGTAPNMRKQLEEEEDNSSVLDVVLGWLSSTFSRLFGRRKTIAVQEDGSNIV
jgi:hypothetical protein